MATQTIVSQSHPICLAEQEPWYAIRAKARHEKIVCNQLETDGFDSYLPTIQQFRQWTDRRKLIDFPLFPGYVFVRIREFASQKTQILRKDGVLRGVEGILVGLGNKNGLVVSVDAIQKSLIIQLQGYGVQVI